MRQGRRLTERTARKKMTPLVVTSILFTAVLHGRWNTVAKVEPDRLAAAALIGLTGFAVAVAIMIGAPVRRCAGAPGVGGREYRGTHGDRRDADRVGCRWSGLISILRPVILFV